MRPRTMHTIIYTTMSIMHAWHTYIDLDAYMPMCMCSASCSGPGVWSSHDASCASGIASHRIPSDAAVISREVDGSDGLGAAGRLSAAATCCIRPISHDRSAAWACTTRHAVHLICWLNLRVRVNNNHTRMSLLCMGHNVTINQVDAAGIDRSLDRTSNCAIYMHARDNIYNCA